MRFSPLFWPIELKGKTIYILDETALPQSLRYLKVQDYKEACLAIKRMKTRAFGQVLLVFYIFLQALKQRKDIFHVAEAINTTRPTLSFKYLTDMVLNWYRQKEALEESIAGFLEKLKNARISQAKKVAELVKDNDCILTHCNISGLFPLIADLAKERKKILKFVVTETRPYLQGARLTAWELHRFGYEVTVIADNTVAKVMSEGAIDKVIVGADHLAQNGDIANKIGTYQIALLAKHFGIPFWVICPPASSTKSGQDIKIEVRPEKELLEFCGKRISPGGVKGYYPAFDITPASLITKHIPLEIEK